jgi:hypothetical protein
VAEGPEDVFLPALFFGNPTLPPTWGDCPSTHQRAHFVTHMTYTDVQHRIWSNALSNYLRTFVGIVVGLVTFRLLYQSMPKESFGFWSLLWSVFGYGILLDFGFGFAAQKRVAELSVSKDWTQLSQRAQHHSVLLPRGCHRACRSGHSWLASAHQLFDVSPRTMTSFVSR